jgi:hypothetical protein
MTSTRFLGALAMARLALAQTSSKAATASSSGKATSPSAAAASAAAKALQAKAAGLNQDFYNYIFIILASLIAALTIWRVGIESVKYVRTLTCLNNDTQRYFALPSKRWASFKKHILYAPIISKRHNKEFQLSSAINVGTLPTRFQLLFLLSYFGTNVVFCVYSIDWNLPVATAAKELRNRTGILAVVNMVCQSDFIRVQRHVYV